MSGDNAETFMSVKFHWTLARVTHGCVCVCVYTLTLNFHQKTRNIVDEKSVAVLSSELPDTFTSFSCHFLFIIILLRYGMSGYE